MSLVSQGASLNIPNFNQMTPNALAALPFTNAINTTSNITINPSTHTTININTISNNSNNFTYSGNDLGSHDSEHTSDFESHDISDYLNNSYNYSSDSDDDEINDRFQRMQFGSDASTNGNNLPNISGIL
jgi:hypothetical protein